MTYFTGISDLAKKVFISLKLQDKTRLNLWKNLLDAGLFDEIRYRSYFERNAGKKIKNDHLAMNYICCAFCSHLKRTHCHSYCFACSKEIYPDCAPLLPGTFPFSKNYMVSFESTPIPWLFKTPCTYFIRQYAKGYYQNFLSHDRRITISNYETLEGLFTGLLEGKRPCHICASVNLKIYNNCSRDGLVKSSYHCQKIMPEIALCYKTISGLIKLA